MSTFVLIDAGGGDLSDPLRLENDTSGNAAIFRVQNNGNLVVLIDGVLITLANHVQISNSLTVGLGLVQTGTASVGFGLTPPADGKLFATKTASSGFIFEGVDTEVTNPFGMLLNFSASSPDDNIRRFLECIDATTARLFIDSDGDVNNHDGIYGTISDETLKQDIEDAASQWDDFKALRFRKFKFKTDVAARGAGAQTKLGLVAQEVRATSPGLVGSSDMRHDQRDPKKPHVPDMKLTLKQSIVFMKGMKALQEAMLRIEALEAGP